MNRHATDHGEERGQPSAGHSDEGSMAAFSLHQFVSAVLVIAKPSINAGRLS